VKFCSETFASLFTCCGSSKLLNSFVAEDFFVFELGVEYALASVQYSYKSRQQTLRTSTKLMSTQHTASFVVDRSRGERVSKRIYYVRPLCYTKLSRSNFFQRLWHNRMTLHSRRISIIIIIIIYCYTTRVAHDTYMCTYTKICS